MEFGVHLPQMSFEGERPTLASLRAYVRAARDLGFAGDCPASGSRVPAPCRCR